MPCFHPLTGWKPPKGRLVFDKKKYSFRGFPPIVVACGQCKGCRLENARTWATRMIHENQMHEKSSFLTLTYNKEKLPENGSLNKRDIVLFIKKLRKRYGKLSYFQCGEYGSPEKTYRPHHHVALFALDFAQDRKHIKNGKHGDPLYSSVTLDEIWGNGRCYIGNITFESAGYIARYCLKKVTGLKQEEEYLRFDINNNPYQLLPPYTTMSRNPAIGLTWLQKYWTDVYPRDEVIIDARPSRPPAYYDSQLHKRDPELLVQLKAKRQEEAKLNEDNNTPERLRVREFLLGDQLKKLIRDTH